MIQECDKGVTGLLVVRYRGAKGLIQGCYRDVTRFFLHVLYKGYKGVTRRFKMCYSSFSGMLQGCYKCVTEMLEGCYRCVRGVLFML